MAVLYDVAPTVSVSPFGFESTTVPATTAIVVDSLSGGGTAVPSGSGVRGGAPNVSGTRATALAAGITLNYMAVQLRYHTIQPNGYVGGDPLSGKSMPASLDTQLDDCKTKGYKIGLRIQWGADAPMGGTQDAVGTPIPDWMTKNNAASLNLPVDFVDGVGNDAGDRHVHIPIVWGQSWANYLQHYKNFLTWLNTWLNGTTPAGTKRSDYVVHVPVAAPTEIGSEMQVGYNTGNAAFNPPQTIDGKTYGNGTNGFPAIPSITPINRASWAKHLPPQYQAGGSAGFNDAQREKWIATQYHNPSNVALYGVPAHGGAWVDSIQAHMDILTNAKSSLAFSSFFADGHAGARDIVRTMWPTYGKNRIYLMATNMRLRKAGNSYPAHTRIDKDDLTWSYRNWAAGVVTDVFDIAVAATAPDPPLIGIQSAGSTGYGGSPGMPITDFERAAWEFVNTWPGTYVETYSAVWFGGGGSQNADQVLNEDFTNALLNPQLAANAALVGGGTAVNALHFTSLATATAGPLVHQQVPFGAGKAQVWYRFVYKKSTTFSAVGTLLFSQSSAGSNNGDLALRLNAQKRLVARWNSSAAADWTDTVTLNDGDLIEVTHKMNGAASGYEVRVNQQVRRTNFALVAPAGALVSFANAGLLNNINGEVWLSNLGASDTSYMGPPGTIQSNGEAPTVGITAPATLVNAPKGSTSITQMGVGTATDPDGISLAEFSVNGGSFQVATLVAGQFQRSLVLNCVPGQDVLNTIVFRATDNFSDPAQRLSNEVTLGVVTRTPLDDAIIVPPAGEPAPPSITPREALQWSVVHKSHDGQALGEDAPTNLVFGVYTRRPGYINYDLNLHSELAVRERTEAYGTDFYLYAGNTLLFAGPHTAVEVDTDNRYITVSGAGWMHYLEVTILEYDSDSPKVLKYPLKKGDPEPDIYEIVEDILDKSIGSDPYAIDLVYNNQKSGITQKFRAVARNGSSLYDIIKGLADQTPGFDFETTVNKEFKMYSPMKGRRSTYILEMGKNVKQVHYSDFGPKANVLLGTAVGGNKDLAFMDVDNDSRRKYRTLGMSDDFGDVTNRSQLVRMTRKELTETSQKNIDIWVTIYPEAFEETVTQFFVGDTLRLRFDLEYDIIDEWRRCTGIERYLNEEGDPQIVFTFTKEDGA